MELWGILTKHWHSLYWSWICFTYLKISMLKIKLFTWVFKLFFSSVPFCSDDWFLSLLSQVHTSRICRSFLTSVVVILYILNNKYIVFCVAGTLNMPSRILMLLWSVCFIFLIDWLLFTSSASPFTIFPQGIVLSLLALYYCFFRCGSSILATILLISPY